MGIALRRLKTTLLFTTDPDNPDRLFKDNSPTLLFTCLRPTNILAFLCITVIACTLLLLLMLGGKGTMSILYPNDDWWCPSFTNHTQNRLTCSKRNHNDYFLCIVGWFFPCMLPSVIFPVLGFLAFYVCIVPIAAIREIWLALKPLDEVDDKYSSYPRLRFMFSENNPDNLYHDLGIDEVYDDQKYALFYPRDNTEGKQFVIKWGCTLLVSNVLFVLTLALLVLIARVIVPFIGLVPIWISHSPLMGCESNMTIAKHTIGCEVIGLAIILIITLIVLLSPCVIRCIWDCKKSFKPPDQVSLIKTKVAGDTLIANYNTL